MLCGAGGENRVLDVMTILSYRDARSEMTL